MSIKFQYKVQPFASRIINKNQSLLSHHIMTIESSTNYSFGTKAIHAGAPLDPSTGAVIEPISLSTTFAQSEPSKPLGIYEYSRSSNPNRDNFEIAVAALKVPSMPLPCHLVLPLLLWLFNLCQSTHTLFQVVMFMEEHIDTLPKSPILMVLKLNSLAI